MRHCNVGFSMIGAETRMARFGEIRRKRSDTLVGTLRHEYGEDFAEGYRSDMQQARGDLSFTVFQRQVARAASGGCFGSDV